MKKSMFIPFAFLGIILASCNYKTTTKLDEKNYDLSTPKCVLEDIKSNLKNDKTIYPKYTYTNTNLYADMVSPSYNKGFVKYSKDDKYYVASFVKNDNIFESVEDINVINEESEYINKYGLSIIAFSTIIDGNPKYYIYDSYGNKILESDDNIYINDLTYINSDENIMEYQLDYLIDYSEYKTTYLRYTYNNNQIQLKQEKERMVVNDDVKYNQETTKGEISRYGYYSLKDYGEDGYYVVNDG